MRVARGRRGESSREGRPRASIVAQVGGPDDPHHSSRFSSRQQSRDADRRCRQARGRGEVACCLLCPRHMYQRLHARFPFVQGPYIHRAVRGPHTPCLASSSCLPAFPSPLAARSTCSSRSRSSKQQGREGARSWALALLLVPACLPCPGSAFKSGTTTDPRLSRIGQVHQIASLASPSPRHSQLAVKSLTLIKSKGTKRISPGSCPSPLS